MDIKTGCWFTDLPEGHTRIGISRGIPRRMAAGYRVFRALAPGPWFNSVSAEEYHRLYQAEVLGHLDPRAVASQLIELARGSVPVMVCYERPGTGQWCHRSMAAEWLAEALGQPIPEVGFEALPQDEHPLLPAHLHRRPVAVVEVQAWLPLCPPSRNLRLIEYPPGRSARPSADECRPPYPRAGARTATRIATV